MRRPGGVPTGVAARTFPCCLRSDGPTLTDGGHGVTVNVAFMNGWMRQEYLYVPGGAAYDVSARGSLVVGSREQSGFRIEAAKWEGPSISGLGYLTPGGFQSLALGVSLDGTTIVGGSDAANDFLAFKIGDNGIMTQLGTLPDLITRRSNGSGTPTRIPLHRRPIVRSHHHSIPRSSTRRRRPC